MDTILNNLRDAFADRKNLPRAMISSGVSIASAPLCLVFFKTPGGLFVHHGMAPFYLYYSILILAVIFGLAEAWAGYWVSGNLNGRLAVGWTIMWVSILPALFVAALGGFAILGKAK